MNNYCIIVTPQAEEQIRDIAYYIAVDLQEPGAAEVFVDELQEAFQTISSNPERQFLVEDEPWHSEGIRKIKVRVGYRESRRSLFSGAFFRLISKVYSHV